MDNTNKKAINKKKHSEPHLKPSVTTSVSERGKTCLYDILMDGVVEYDTDRNIINCNPAYEKMTGYSLSELKGMPINKLIPAKCREQEQKINMDSSYCRQFHSKHIKKDGTIFPVEKSVYLTNKHYIAVVKDITQSVLDKKELVAHTKILKKTNAELDNFASIISHDLKTPITTISAFMKIFEEDYFNQLDKTGQDIILRVKSSIKQMNTTINDLRDLSKLSKVENPFENVDIHGLIKAVIDRIGFVYEDKLLLFNIESNMPIVLCDRIKIDQVFSNLIDNALKYSSKKSGKTIVVEIGYKNKNDFHLFYVKDNGIGIEEIYLERIFHLFERLHTSDEYEGTGAGLFIVENIIKQHEGQVWADSVIGEGTTFYFTIRKKLKP